MGDDEVWRLGSHMEKLLDETPLLGGANRMFRTVAAGILANPQAHIDALVEAGVLEKFTTPTHVSAFGCDLVDTQYRVVQPHKHEWRVTTLGLETVGVGCPCGEVRSGISKILPIEVPGD